MCRHVRIYEQSLSHNKMLTHGRAIVSDNLNLERDISSQAIINRNQTEYLRRLAVKQDNIVKHAELENLKLEVAELKALVTRLLSSQINFTK